MHDAAARLSESTTTADLMTECTAWWPDRAYTRLPTRFPSQGGPVASDAACASLPNVFGYLRTSTLVVGTKP